MLINSTTVKSLDLVDGSKLTFDLATTKKEDVCITTPLFVSEYKNGINLGLVRMLNNNTDVGFGKGTNLNVCYKLAKTNDTTLVLTHPTFEQEQFVLDNNTNTFKSTISDRYIIKQEESEMYTLCSGNTLFVFDLTGGTSSNIKELHEQNVTFNFVYDSHEKIIEISNNNDLKEKAVFTYNEDENCTSITSSKKMNVDSDTFTQIGKTELTYTNNIVSQVSIKMHNKTAIKRKSIFTETTTQIVVSDGISLITNTIKLTKNSSTNKYYVTEVDVDNQQLLVLYGQYKTTLQLELKVSENENDNKEINKEEYFFNKNYELSFVKANDRIVKAFNYELNERHRLLSISKELYVKPELNGEYILPLESVHSEYDTVTDVIDDSCPANSSVKEIQINPKPEITIMSNVSLSFNKPGTRLDVLSALVWYKSLSASSSSVDSIYAKLSLVNSDGVITSKTIYNTQEINMKNLNDWNLMVLSIQADEDFEKVNLEFNSSNTNIRLRVHSALFVDSFTTIYRYDRDGKIDATLTGKEYNFYKFNQDNQLMLSKNAVNSYDGNGRVIQSVSPKKVVSSTTYDDKGNVTSQKVHKANETGFLGKQFTYVDGELLTQATNEDLTTQTFGYDSYKRQNTSSLGSMSQTTTFVSDNYITYGNVKNVELKENNVLNGKLTYVYDTSNSNLVRATSTTDGEVDETIKFEYDSKNRTNKISHRYTVLTPSTPDDSEITIGPAPDVLTEQFKTLYQCTYDDMGNIKSYNYGDSSKNVSYEYEETDRTTLNNVKKIKYCNQDKYLFNYSTDGKGSLEEVISYDTFDENGDELSTNYEYDNNKLVAIKTKGGSATYHTNELKYNQNNEAFIERNITGESVLETEYLDSSKIAFDSINGFEYSLLCEQDDDLYWTMFIDRKVMVNDKIIDWSHVLSNKNGQILPYPLAYDISDVDYESNNQYRDCGLRMFIVPNQTAPYYLNFRKPSDEEGIENYDHSTRKLELGNRFSVFFCTKVNAEDEYPYILTLPIYGLNEKIRLIADTNSLIFARINNQEFDENNKIIVQRTGLWNNIHFFAINISQNSINNGNVQVICEVYMDNSLIGIINTIFENYIWDIEFFDGGTGEINNELSTVILNTSKHLSEDKIEEYTNRLKAIYNKGESYPENFVITLDNNVGEYDTIALHNTFESKNGLKPIKQLNNPGIVNIQDNFEFVDNAIDTNVGNYVYAMRNQTLKYDLGLTDSGMVGIRFNNVVNKSGTFLQLNASNQFKYVIETITNQLYVKFNNTTIHTESIFNQWDDVIITWTKYIQSGSLETEMCKLKIFANGVLVHSYSFELTDELSSIISLGKLDTDESTTNETIGYIDKVIYSDQFISDETASKLHNEMSKQCYLKDTCDDLGRKTSRKVKTRSNSKLDNIYEYKQNVSSNVSTQTNILNKETLKIDNIEKENRRYTYDSLGNVNNITITDNFHSSTISTSYTYGKGQLTKEFVASYPGSYTNTIEYSYDGRGNITSILKSGSASKTFEYSTNGLLLTKVNDSTITYDGLFPKYVKDENGNTIKELEFEGRRLKSLIDYNDNKKYCYFYNASGLREQKKVYNKTTNDLLSSVDYYYNSRNLLVSEVRKTYNSGTLLTTYDIMYMYDSNGMLYAFKYNGDVFYYVRDALGNINHIVNQDGELESSYTYEAYGSHTVLNAQGSTSTLSTLIGNINPFRYKGYYYDVETQLFYCNSRYYSPELCRWISPDSIEYLDPESINGLNLYCYCYNNPISYADPSGNLPQWAEWLIGGALVVGAIALTIVTAGAGGALAAALGGSLLATIGSGVVVGAAVGAVSGMMINAGTQLITNGTENFSWSEFGKSAWTGAIAGGIAGGLFAGIQYGLSAGKIANSVSGLSKAQTRLSNVFKPLGNVKNLANAPFSGANIAKTVGNVAANYNSAYSAYILAKGTNAIVNVGMGVAYFLFENLTSDLIGMAF